jgi:hypothetical protein
MFLDIRKAICVPFPMVRNFYLNIKLLSLPGGKTERLIDDIFVVLILASYKNGSFSGGSLASHTDS